MSPNLKETLKKLGYEPNNEGLSKARSNSIKEILLEKVISDTIINIKTLYEQGQQTVDDSYRYVYADFVYLEKNTTSESSNDNRVIKSIKKTYVLQKDITPAEATGKEVKERKKLSFPSVNIGSIFKHKTRSSVNCPNKI